MRLALVLVSISLHLAYGFCPATDADAPPGVLTADIDPSELEGDEVFTEAYDSDGNPQFIDGTSEKADAFDGNKILQEFGNAVTSPKMDKIYSLGEKKTSALLMLEYVLAATSFDQEYMTNVFMRIAAVNTKEALAEKKFSEKSSLEFLSKILHHLQTDPPEVEKGQSPETTENTLEEEKMKDEL